MGISLWRYNFSVTVLLLMIVVLSDGVMSVIVTRLTRGPEYTVSKEGQTAVMNCTVDHGTLIRESIKWYRVSNDEFSALSDNSRIEPMTRPATGNYEITGNHQEGEYNLRITRVDRRDSGVYHCGFEQGSSRTITSLGAELLVVVPPSSDSPSCVLMTASDNPSSFFMDSLPPVFSVGDSARLMCMSSGGIPAATLTWKRRGTRLTGRTTHSNVLDIVIQESDLDVEFTCKAESPALDSLRSCSLVPARRPHVIRIMPERPVVSLRGGITLSCEADDVSPDDEDAVWQWFFKGNKVPSESDPPRRFSGSSSNKSLTIGMVVAADAGAEIVCQLTTKYRTGRATTSLQVEGIRPRSEVVTSTPDFSSVSYDYDNMTDATGVPSDTAPVIKMYLIIASSIAGVAIAALVVILIAFIYRRHAKSKRTNANNSNNPESIPEPPPDVRPKQMIQVKSPINRNRKRVDTSAARLSSDGDYTALQRAKVSTGGEYQSICRSPPTAPRSDLAAAATADNDMCWEYEIPYTVDTLNNVKPANITNPDYLEIM
ncbi:uncharacterized protein [Asterias amurensis]|uniref:uncharacterized protein n=1 Tax=Asterias amurensis TaxID=7602 RepID=UPI003AB86C91